MNQLALFEDPVYKLRRPPEPILRTAMISGTYRWELRRQWGGGPCIAWVGLNPSTADGATDDPTMWREMSFSMAWGFGSLVKVNVYPFITSKPADLNRWRESYRVTTDVEPELGPVSGDKDADDAYTRNVHHVADVLKDADIAVAAWGNGADADIPDWLDDVSDLFAWSDALMDVDTTKKIAWHCLGTNADGSPRHTLARGRNRVPDDQRPVAWERPQ